MVAFGPRSINFLEDAQGEEKLLSWPFDPTSTYEVQGWGFWLAIFGLLLTVIGFAVTFVQLLRTKKATTAVSSEIRKIQFAVSRYNAVTETARAETALLAARQHVRSSEWPMANDALEAFSKALHTLKELQVPELATHEAKLDTTITHADRLCERLDNLDAAGAPKIDAIKTQSALRDHDKLITSIRVALDRSNIGE